MRNGSKRGDFVTAMPNGGAVTTISDARTPGRRRAAARTVPGVSYARTAGPR